MVKFYKKTALILATLVATPFLVSAATISIVPANGTYEVGDTITVKVVVSSPVSMNAVSSSVFLSPEFFSIQSISKANSILDFWVTEPSFDKKTGIVNFEGVALSGFQGSGGTVETMQVKALKVGSAKLSLLSGQILANDGKGTDITGNMTGAMFTIVEPREKVTPTPPPLPEPAPVEVIKEQVQALPSLKAPEIMIGTKYGALSIVGTSDYPKAQVLMTFVAGDGSKIIIIGAVDNDGSFNIVVPSSLKHGNYDVNAQMVREDKSNSEKSNSIMITVGSIFSDASPWIIWVIILLLILLLYLLARIHHHLYKDKNIHVRLRKESHKAEDVAHKSFDILREDVASYDDEESPASRRKISSEIKKDIDSAEKVIENEIKDIGSL